MADRLIVIIPDGADTILHLLDKNLNGKSSFIFSYYSFLFFRMFQSHFFFNGSFLFFSPAWFETGDAGFVSFEERAYEAIIASVIGIQTEEYDFCCLQAQEILADFKVASIISIQKQEQMRILKNKVSGMIAKIKAYRKSMEELLEDDEELAMMNLSKLKKKPSLYRCDSS